MRSSLCINRPQIQLFHNISDKHPFSTGNTPRRKWHVLDDHHFPSFTQDSSSLLFYYQVRLDFMCKKPFISQTVRNLTLYIYNYVPLSYTQMILEEVLLLFFSQYLDSKTKNRVVQNKCSQVSLNLTCDPLKQISLCICNTTRCPKCNASFVCFLFTVFH